MIGSLKAFIFIALAALTGLVTFSIANNVHAQDVDLNGATGDILIVGNKGEDSVSFIDLKTGREIGRQPSGKNPHEIALSPNGKHVAVVSYGESNIDIFDVFKRELIEKIDLGSNSNPHGLVWLSDDRIIATTEGSDSIIILSPANEGKRELTAIPTGQKGSHMVVVDKLGKFAYVANLQSASVSKIDLIRGEKIVDVPTGAGTEGVAITPDGKEIYVSARETNMVTVLDSKTMQVLKEIAVGKFPLRVIISPDGKYAVTSNLADGSLSVINTATKALERTIKVSGQDATRQVTILFSFDGKYIYVAETGIDRIAEIDFKTGKLVGRLAAGKDGDGLAILDIIIVTNHQSPAF